MFKPGRVSSVGRLSCSYPLFPPSLSLLACRFSVSEVWHDSKLILFVYRAVDCMCNILPCSSKDYQLFLVFVIFLNDHVCLECVIFKSCSRCPSPPNMHLYEVWLGAATCREVLTADDSPVLVERRSALWCNSDCMKNCHCRAVKSGSPVFYFVIQVKLLVRIVFLRL